MYISIHSLCSILSWSTFGSNYSLKYFWVWCFKLGTSIFGKFLPFYFAGPLKLHQVGWGVSVPSHFQISPKMFNRVQVWLWLGHSRTFTELSQSHSFVILAVCLGSLSCWKMNLRPSLRSRALLEQVFIKDLSVHCWIHLSSILTSLPVPAAEKHPHSMMLPPPCFTVGMVLGYTRWWAVPGFLQTWRLALAFQTSSIYGWWRPLCSMGPSMLQTFFCTLPQICAPRYNPVSEVYRQFLRLHGLVCALTCTVNCGTLYRQVWAFPNHVHSTEFTTGGLQSSCRNISRMISGYRMHRSSILSVMAKALNTWVHVIFFVFYFL